jgi:hypothetical protein
LNWSSRNYNGSTYVSHLESSLRENIKLVWDPLADFYECEIPADRPILKFGLRSLGIEFEEDMVDQGKLSSIFKKSTTNIGSWPRTWSDFLSIAPRFSRSETSYTVVMESYQFWFTTPQRRLIVL